LEDIEKQGNVVIEEKLHEMERKCNNETINLNQCREKFPNEVEECQKETFRLYHCHGKILCTEESKRLKMLAEEEDPTTQKNK